MGMTQHTLKYIHKRRGFCKAEKIPETPEKHQNQRAPATRRQRLQKIL